MEEGVGLTGEESGPKKRDRSTFLDKEGGGGGGWGCLGEEVETHSVVRKYTTPTQLQDTRKI